MVTTHASASLNQDEKLEDAAERKKILRMGWKTLFSFTTRKHLPVVSGAVISAVIAALSLPVVAIIYGLIFRDYTAYGAGRLNSHALLSSVSRYCSILAGIVALTWLANSVYFFLFLTFGELQARNARNKIFETLVRKDMAWYDTRDNGIAALLPAIQMNIRDLQLSVSAPLGEGLQCIIQGVGALGVAFYYSWNLTLVILCTVPLIYLFQSFLAQRLSVQSHSQANQLQQALKHITSAIHSIEIVKCFNGEQQETEKFSKVTALAASLYKRVANLRALQISIMQFFTMSVFVQGFWYGSHLVHSGNRDVGQIITTFWAALMAIQGITGFLPQFIVLQHGKLAGSRLQALMKQITTEDESQELQGHLRPERCSGDVEFREVTFSYPTRIDEIAIHNLSLFFPAGETTFVIGKSGSGKSTLGQLLVRFYQPVSGAIFVDGNQIDGLNVHWLRQNVTLVEQHSVLFNDTIQKNIALGRPGQTISTSDIQAAMKFAMLENIVNDLPEGLDTHLGMKGSSLSGGQKQRMALARARIRDTPILVLDESTSALDYVTRAAILQAIREWRKGKTTIIITHDITQIQQDDFLYLLDQGRVVQEGYRKQMENQPGGFQDFLASFVEQGDTGTENSDGGSEYEGATDEIISLYDESWDLHIPMHRPLSAVLFGESVLQSFLKPNRDSELFNFLPSRDKSVRRSQYLGHLRETNADVEDVPESSAKSLPNAPESAPGAFGFMNPLSRPLSRSSNRTSMVDPHMYFRPLQAQTGTRSRPASIMSTRPASRRANYPRPLSIRNPSFPQVQQQPRTPYKRRLRLRFTGKSDSNQETQQSSSTSTIPIMEIFKSVWPVLTWRPRLLLLGALLCAFIHAAATPVFAWLFAQLVTTFYSSGNEMRRALVYALSILAVAIGDGIASYLLFFLSDSVAQFWAQALKVEAFRRILLQPREFFDREDNSISRLAETLDHFAEEARNLPGRFASLFVSIFAMIAISISWSLVTSWKLALVAIACGPVLFGIAKAYNMVSGRWERLANEADHVVGDVLHETFVNIRTVRCLNLENEFRARYQEATTAAVNVGIKRAFYSASIFGIHFAGILFTAVLLFYYGAVLVANDEYSVTSIVETFLILMLSVNHVAYMGNYITQINISRDAGGRLLRLARLPTTSHETTGTESLDSAGDVVLSNVSFKYPTRPDITVLHDVSLSIPYGRCTAIVGASGSGKSTIAALLLKLYATDPTIGLTPSLTVSGSDIRSLDTRSLRARVALVSQSPVIFPGTIAQNIAYGLSASSPLASQESIKAAAVAAGIAEFVDSLPQGYNTMVGDGGTGLSGGQAQRLAIARALIRNPDILVLDEATSALDGVSAAVVRDTVLKLVRGAKGSSEVNAELNSPKELHGVGDDVGVVDSGKGTGQEHTEKKMTVLIITHAREMMAIAEQIIMLDKGRVVEVGSYGELRRRRGGAFARLLRGEQE